MITILAILAAALFLFIGWDERRLRRNRRCLEARQRDTEDRIAARRKP